MKHKEKESQFRNLSGKPPSGSKVFSGFTLILILYSIITVITPNLNTFDSNGPKFLALAVVNLGVFFFFVFSGKLREISEKLTRLLMHPLGIVYLLFLLLSILSFTKAQNIRESILLIAQIFTVFISAVFLYLVLSKDKKYFGQLSIILVLILMFDCLVIFGNIFLYIIGEIGSIGEIKSVYSNKNILSSVIFLKIVFSLWLQQFGDGKWKTVGSVATFFGIMATLLLSTRAFYMGLAVMTFIYLAFQLIRYIQTRESGYFKIMITYSGTLILALCLMFVIQSFLYPVSKDSFNMNVVQRIETINTRESSAKTRLETWKFSDKMIKKDPLLGVGLGNWKTAELEYEAPIREDFEYMFRNHNDFLEVTAETGIPGGITYLLLIFLPMGFFVIILFFRADASSLPILFISTFGLLCYSFDAFFNFPMTRPEVQILFAIFISSSFCVSFTFNQKESVLNHRPGRVFLFVAGTLMIPVIIILNMYFVSLRYQRIAHEEVESGYFGHSADEMISGYPAIPTINAGGEPITVTKSRYLINDGRFEEAISLLKNDRTSPFDGRFELFLMYAYEKMNKNDSVIFYAKKVHERKPYYYPVVEKICMLQQEAGDYRSPIILLSKELKRKPGNFPAREYRARCYFFLREYQNCINDLNLLIQTDSTDSKLINIRGICHNGLKDDVSACRDFQRAMKLGSQEASDNYSRVCGELKK